MAKNRNHKNNKNKVEVEFVGHNAEGVTGSAILVKYNNSQIILDLGQEQGGDKFENFIANKNLYTGIKVSDIDLVIPLHLNIDHLSGTPLIVSKGYENPILIPKNSTSIARVLLTDSQYIGEKEAKLFSKYKNKEYSPAYTKDDVNKTLGLMQELEFKEKIELSRYIPNLEGEIILELIPAGHIPLSSQVILKFQDGANWKTLCYTSDIGNFKNNSKLIQPLERIKSCDLLIGECTYSKKPEKIYDRETDIQELMKTIKYTLNNNGKVLIPAFSMSRAQEILSVLYTHYRDCPYEIIMDSPMMIEINNLYRTRLLKDGANEYMQKILKWDKVRQIRSSNSSKVCIQDKEPKIIIASSGMITNYTRSAFHLASLVEDSNSTVCFVGYCSPRTLGNDMQQKYGTDNNIVINDVGYKINANVSVFHSFSSHMNYYNLLEYYSSINTPKICLVHSEMKSKKEFAVALQERCSEKCKTTEVIAVSKGQKMFI